MNSFGLAYQNAMVADSRRLLAYQKALTAVIRPGDVVVDVGAGTGVLALMAAKAGAARVYTIDSHVPIEIVREIAKINGVQDRLIPVLGESSKVTLPERGDIVIAEIGLDEATLLDAKTRMLRPGGRMMPGVVSIGMAPVHAPIQYANLIEFWNGDHVGLSFSSLRPIACNVVHRTSMEGVHLSAPPRSILTVSPAEISSPMVSGTAVFDLQSDDVIHGLAAWHRIEIIPGVWHEAPPPGPQESWAHFFLPFSTPLHPRKGSALRLSVIKREHLWIWRASCEEWTCDQSTFASMPLKATETTAPAEFA
jgi:protein arginine N-methyltransferase 1